MPNAFDIAILDPRRIDDRTVSELAAVLVDAVESGAAVSFVLPFPIAAAVTWWRRTLETPHPKAVFLVARDERHRLVGTVQLQPAWAPNQPHRAEVCKMIVHRDARGQGLGRALMHAVEDAARDTGFTLLTLDAKRGGHAEALYRSMGWTYIGAIPGFAVDPDGVTLHDDALFYKQL